MTYLPIPITNLWVLHLALQSTSSVKQKHRPVHSSDQKRSRKKDWYTKIINSTKILKLFFTLLPLSMIMKEDTVEAATHMHNCTHFLQAKTESNTEDAITKCTFYTSQLSQHWSFIVSSTVFGAVTFVFLLSQTASKPIVCFQSDRSWVKMWHTHTNTHWRSLFSGGVNQENTYEWSRWSSACLNVVCRHYSAANCTLV